MNKQRRGWASRVEAVAPWAALIVLCAAGAAKGQSGDYGVPGVHAWEPVPAYWVEEDDGERLESDVEAVTSDVAETVETVESYVEDTATEVVNEVSSTGYEAASSVNEAAANAAEFVGDASASATSISSADLRRQRTQLRARRGSYRSWRSADGLDDAVESAETVVEDAAADATQVLSDLEPIEPIYYPETAETQPVTFVDVPDTVATTSLGHLSEPVYSAPVVAAPSNVPTEPISEPVYYEPETYSPKYDLAVTEPVQPMEAPVVQTAPVEPVVIPVVEPRAQVQMADQGSAVTDKPLYVPTPMASAATVTQPNGVTQNPPHDLHFGNGSDSEILQLQVGRSLMLDLRSDAKRVSVANPEVAEVLIISPRQVMVNGLSEGGTSIIIWDRRGNYTMHNVLIGEQLDAQVMLEVIVAEINRTEAERHGFDLRAIGNQFGLVTQYGGVAEIGGSNPPKAGDPFLPLALDGGLSWAVVDLKNDIAALFKQLQSNNLGRILAEPKLLARSGKEANFLSGGEIPIVVSTNDDTSIEFKEFGTKVKFVPVIRPDGTVNLTLLSEVSEPDFALGVELFGFAVPAFVTRRTETDVTLASGESLIVAGLIKESETEHESKMPFLGDVPVIRYLFRRTEWTNDKVELVIVVKPRIVRGIGRGQRVALPTDRGPLEHSETRTGPVDQKLTRPRPY